MLGPGYRILYSDAELGAHRGTLLAGACFDLGFDGENGIGGGKMMVYCDLWAYRGGAHEAIVG